MKFSELIEYCRLPEEYISRIGRLGWSDNGDAIEYIERDPFVGMTFAVGPEIGNFLEGFCSVRDPIHFGHIVHLMHILGQSRTPPPDWSAELSEIFIREGRPARNAGAFLGVLTKEVPTFPVKIDIRELCSLLWRSNSISFLALDANHVEGRIAHVPPLGFYEFESICKKALANYGTSEIQSWMRRGRGVVNEGRELADHIELPKRSFADRLSALSKYDRLSKSCAMVSDLNGILIIAPVNRISDSPPIGGYSDLNTRGSLDQVLPHQLALDNDEFLRRYVSNELLYFKREDPADPFDRELILLLDQGVRTWGNTRVILTGAVLAFASKSERYRAGLKLLTTGKSNELIPVMSVSDESLVGLLEASDLSITPASAIGRLARLLSSGETSAEEKVIRDVVILTHPRNLRSAEVTKQLAFIPEEIRLFACAVDDEGHGVFARIVSGVPVSPREFRVNVHQEVDKPDVQTNKLGFGSEWSGDIEPVAYPMPIAPPVQIDSESYDGLSGDLDYAGEWFLCADEDGFLHAVHTATGRSEVWPSPQFGILKRDKVQYRRIKGVQGGFVVALAFEDDWLIVYYSVRERYVHLISVPEGLQIDFFGGFLYLRSLHTIVLEEDCVPYQDKTIAVLNLTTLRFISPDDDLEAFNRVRKYAGEYGEALPKLRIVTPESLSEVEHLGVYLIFDEESGSIALMGVVPLWRRFTPMDDGRPRWKGADLIVAQKFGNIVILIFREPKTCSQTTVRYEGPYGTFIEETDNDGYCCSGDGSIIVYKPKNFSGLQIGAAATSGPPMHSLPAVDYKTRIPYVFGTMNTATDRLIISTNSTSYELDWGGELLSVTKREGSPSRRISDIRSKVDMPAMIVGPTKLESSEKTMGGRFVSEVELSLTYRIDRFGMVMGFDRRDNLVVCYCIDDSDFAAWIPSGVRMGPESLTGGPETEGAARLIAKALKLAIEQDRGSFDELDIFLHIDNG